MPLAGYDPAELSNTVDWMLIPINPCRSMSGQYDCYQDSADVIHGDLPVPCKSHVRPMSSVGKLTVVAVDTGAAYFCSFAKPLDPRSYGGTLDLTVQQTIQLVINQLPCKRLILKELKISL
ncbi:MAG: hypothetical protein JRE23_12240 [Deltaproteobacteria bacterium]|nr:hypothetical protein [Deltaproteobacteria bacterium]